MARHRAKLDRLHQAGEVIRRLKSQPPGRERERLLAVRFGLEGAWSLQEIARRVGRSRATIQSWFDAYRSGGIERLCQRSSAKRGPRSRLHERAAKELRKKLAKGSFRRAEEARVWLERRFGIQARTVTVRAWLRKLGAGLKVVRPRHPRSGEAPKAEFRAQLARRLYGALAAGDQGLRERPVRIWVADEARFGLQPDLRRAWVSRGTRAHKSSRREYEWRYVWAALQVGGAGCEFLYTDHADRELSSAFLKQISRRDPYALHAVIWDGAGFHPENGHSRLPENVVVLRQPPYSPELNPVEKLWDMLRDGLCNRTWRNLEHLLEQATRWLRAFWSDPGRTFSLVGHGWLLDQANA